MPTLHTVTENTKRILKYGGFIVLIIISIVLIYRGGVFLKDYFFPTPVDPPTVSFGKLPTVQFPESLPSQNLSFEVDTISGSLPTFTTSENELIDRMNVYRIFNPEFSLLDLQNAKQAVKEVGFLGREVSLGDNIYQWSSIQEGLEKSIEMNIVNKNFNYASAFRTFGRILLAENMPDSQSAISTTKRFLSSMNLFPEDIDETKTKTELLKIQGTKLLPAEKLPDAQIIHVNFFQKDIGDFPIFYANPPNSSIDFFVGSGERFDPEIVEGLFYHQLFTEDFATYPIKPVSQAFQELQDGKGYIGANFVPESTIKIKDIKLGYYASPEFQEYLIPIYIFKGLDDEFYAYVHAIPDEWYSEKSEETEKNL